MLTIVNIFFVFFSAWVAYGCYKRGQRTSMWFNIFAVAMNLLAVGMVALSMYAESEAAHDKEFNVGIVQTTR